MLDCPQACVRCFDRTDGDGHVSDKRESAFPRSRSNREKAITRDQGTDFDAVHPLLGEFVYDCSISGSWRRQVACASLACAVVAVASVVLAYVLPTEATGMMLLHATANEGVSLEQIELCRAYVGAQQPSVTAFLKKW